MALHVVTMPDTERWAMSDEHAQVVASRIIGDRDIRLEYWPRCRAGEAWSRHRDAHPSMDETPGYHYPIDMAYQLRGYSLVSLQGEWIAVVFVDEREDYESATFVALHELAHLLVREQDDDEIHADLIASAMMTELGYPEGVLEAKPSTGRPCPQSVAARRRLLSR